MLRKAVLVLAVALLAAASAARADIILFNAKLDWDQERPIINPPSPATGTGTFVYDTDTNVLQFEINFSGLLGTEVAAHFHAAAPRGVTAPVVINLPPGSPKIGSVDFDTLFGANAELRESQLRDGLFYVNIHTQPGRASGEIRGQVDPAVPEPGTIALFLVGGAGLAALRLRRRVARAPKDTTP